MNLNEKLISTYTQLPNTISKDLINWSLNKQKQYKNKSQYIDAILKEFAGGEFYYSLTPQDLGNDYSAFFFKNKEGYCEYYAGTFAVLARLANIPTRIGFQVSSKIDSRTIIDQGGAEQLLGYGDMLYLPPGVGVPIRVHGAFVGDDEVHRVVDDWKSRAEPDYIDNIVNDAQDTGPIPGWSGSESSSGSAEDSDELYDEAVNFVIESRRASISAVQRKLRIGYNRAARLIEAMEEAGLVSEMSSNGSREVLVPKR